MSFESRLLHELTISRQVDTGTFDALNQPIRVPATVATIRGLPQPKEVREVALISEAGAVIGDWTIYVLPMLLLEADQIVHDAATCPMPGVTDLPSGTWEITGVRNPAGVGHHFEVDAKLLGATPPA